MVTYVWRALRLLSAGHFGRSRQGSLKSRIASQPGTAMRDFMAVTKALADENRVRILLALRHGELCVCQIVELLGLATSTISKHMSILKQAYLVDSRKDGRWIYYRLAGEEAPEAACQVACLASELLANDPQTEFDEQRLEEIRSQDPHDLCVCAMNTAGRASDLKSATSYFDEWICKERVTLQ